MLKALAILIFSVELGPMILPEALPLEYILYISQRSRTMFAGRISSFVQVFLNVLLVFTDPGNINGRKGQNTIAIFLYLAAYGTSKGPPVTGSHKW